MSESSIPEGTETLTKGQALDHLLSTPAPEEASEILQEPVAEAETQVEAEEPLVEEVESDDAVELSEEETEEADVEYEATEDDDEQPEEAFEESDDVEEYYTVKIDGEEKQVTADELVKNYQLEQAAQRRMQEAASERKQAEAEREVIAQQREQYEQGFECLVSAAYGARATKNIGKSSMEDPLEYVKQRDAVRDRKENLAKVQQEQMRVQQEKQQEMVKVHQEHLAKESQRLLERIPEWRDEEVATREKQQVIQYASVLVLPSKNYKLPLIVVLSRHYAKHTFMMSLWLKSQQKKGKKSTESNQVLASLLLSPRLLQNAKTQAFDRLKKSGSKEAAVEYLLERNR